MTFILTFGFALIVLIAVVFLVLHRRISDLEDDLEKDRGTGGIAGLSDAIHEFSNSPSFTERQVHIRAVALADEAARSEIEVLAQETCGPSGYNSPPIYFVNALADPSEGAKGRLSSAIAYLQLRASQNGKPLPWQFHVLADKCWFEPWTADEPARRPIVKQFEFDKCSLEQAFKPSAIDEFTAQEVPQNQRVLEIERQAVKRLYDMEHRWTGREWLGPVEPVIVSQPIERAAVPIMFERGYRWDGKKWKSPDDGLPENTVWTCKVGLRGNRVLANGADAEPRQAVQKVIAEMMGQECDFCFSGWNGKLTRHEQDVIDNT